MTDTAKAKNMERTEPGYENMDHFIISTGDVSDMLRTIDFQQVSQGDDNQEICEAEEEEEVAQQSTEDCYSTLPFVYWDCFTSSNYNGLTLLLFLAGCTSPVTESKEVYPDFPFENGNSGPAIELERHVGQHCHGKATKTVESRETQLARKKLYIASVVCLIFMIGEVIGGYLAHSLAIMTDAAHLLTDFGTVLVYLAIIRIVNNDYEIEGYVMVITSGCAVGVNIIMAYILHQSTTFHSHSHGSGYHKLDDAVESPESLGHGHSHFGHHGNTSPEYKVADPICTFLFSVFVLGTTVTILRDVFRILMEGAPKTIQFNSVKEVLLSLKGVKAMHSLRLWALTLSHTMLSVHIAIEEDADAQTVLKEATELLQNKFDFYSMTIQVENYCEDMSHCTQCQDPTE
ncbi:Zinc transporter 2 [Acipenser ruthenus]|uniref:Probable proton-coupled zinc antiporter SLC30A3 n=1 Tax=Acipenser ruthenus TaxID=7906 RepID=A0A444UGQ2_ACIRT|nr:Zinc transporter 2 [Acipenser ruthenus]